MEGVGWVLSGINKHTPTHPPTHTEREGERDQKNFRDQNGKVEIHSRVTMSLSQKNICTRVYLYKHLKELTKRNSQI